MGSVLKHKIPCRCCNKQRSVCWFADLRSAADNDSCLPPFKMLSLSTCLYLNVSHKNLGASYVLTYLVLHGDHCELLGLSLSSLPLGIHHLLNVRTSNMQKNLITLTEPFWPAWSPAYSTCLSLLLCSSKNRSSKNPKQNTKNSVSVGSRLEIIHELYKCSVLSFIPSFLFCLSSSSFSRRPAWQPFTAP